MVTSAADRIPAGIDDVDAEWIAHALSGSGSRPVFRGYRARLAEHGVTDYGFDQAWRHYRYAVAYLMVLSVITLVGWDGLPERSGALCLTLVDRAVVTIDEVGALEVFE
jgi:hypothetical protein